MYTSPGPKGQIRKFWFTGGSVGFTPSQDTRAADETAIRAAEAGLGKGFADLDPAAAVSFYTDDIVVMGVDSTVIHGKDNMQKRLETILKDKPEISFGPATGEVARSGDLAYSWCMGKTSRKDSEGKVTETTIKHLMVWKKQADGGWKLAFGSVTPDPPEKKK